MATYQPYAQQTPRRSADLAAWALVAIVVAILCAAAGWAIARQTVLGDDDVARVSELAARNGVVNGERSGYADGAKLGRKEAALRARTQIDAARREAARTGYDAGFAAGRARAGDPDAYTYSTAGAGATAGSAFDDAAAADLLASDVPGFSDSAFDSLGYGSGATQPYLGAASRGTGLGDDYTGALGY